VVLTCAYKICGWQMSLFWGIRRRRVGELEWEGELGDRAFTVGRELPFGRWVMGLLVDTGSHTPTIRQAGTMPTPLIIFASPHCSSKGNYVGTPPAKVTCGVTARLMLSPLHVLKPA